MHNVIDLMRGTAAWDHHGETGVIDRWLEQQGLFTITLDNGNQVQIEPKNVGVMRDAVQATPEEQSRSAKVKTWLPRMPRGSRIKKAVARLPQEFAKKNEWQASSVLPEAFTGHGVRS